MPSSVRRPRAGIQPDTYPFGTLSRNQKPIQNGPIGIILGWMGDLPTPTKDMEIERSQEYAVSPMRGFGISKTTLGTWRYGSELESAMGIQSVAHRGILSRQGIRAPHTNRITSASHTLDWGMDYGYTPNGGTVMLNDLTPGLLQNWAIFASSGGALCRGRSLLPSFT